MRDNHSTTLPVRQAFKSDAFAAAAAAGALGRKLDTREAVKIVALLKSGDPATREKAYQTLARYGGRDYVGYIVRGLNDPDIRIRVETCRLLGDLRAHAVKRQLYDAVVDRNAYVRCAAAEALAKMGDKYGLPYVARLVCISGKHQIEALRSYNFITGRKFKLGESGVNDAVKWIRHNQGHMLA